MTKVIDAFRDYAEAKMRSLSFCELQGHCCLFIVSESLVLKANEQHV